MAAFYDRKYFILAGAVILALLSGESGAQSFFPKKQCVPVSTSVLGISSKDQKTTSPCRLNKSVGPTEGLSAQKNENKPVDPKTSKTTTSSGLESKLEKKSEIELPD